MTKLNYWWIVVALVAVAVTQGGVESVRRRYEPRNIRTPKLNVTELPETIGDWQAQTALDGDTGLNAEMLRSIAADEAMTRLYMDADGRQCSVHLAMWHETDEWLPHPPMMCYGGVGYSLYKENRLVLPEHPDVSVWWASFQDGVSGERIELLHWYQMGPGVYVLRDEARDLRRSFWGTPTRPPLVKVLVQSPIFTDDTDRQKVEELAAGVFEFVSRM